MLGEEVERPSGIQVADTGWDGFEFIGMIEMALLLVVLSVVPLVVVVGVGVVVVVVEAGTRIEVWSTTAA